MCWLCPTTCLYITTLSTEGEQEGLTRQKVGLGAKADKVSGTCSNCLLVYRQSF